MKILVIAPHPDDESIGCGGTICLHKERGDRVFALFLTSGELGLKQLPCEEARRIREREANSAAEILGIDSATFLRLPDCHLGETISEASWALRRVLRDEAPQRIYLPHIHESHPDHRACAPIVRAALRTADVATPLLLAYEVWTPLRQYDDGEDITAFIARKLKAIRCYRSQTRQLRYDRAAKGLNQYRGALAWGCAFAELFQYETFTGNGTPAVDVATNGGRRDS